MSNGKRVGRKMAAVASFVARCPGRSMMAAATEVAPRGSLKFGYRTVHRAIDAGLVWAVEGNGRTRLYPLVCAEHSDCAEYVALAAACTATEAA